MTATTLSRIAAVAWLAGSAIRLLAGATGGIVLGDTATTMMAVGIGAVLGLLVGLAMWLRPGRGSSLAGIFFGFYAVLGLLYLGMFDTNPWFVAIDIVGIIAFAVSVAAFVRAGRERSFDA